MDLIQGFKMGVGLQVSVGPLCQFVDVESSGPCKGFDSES